MSFSKFVTFSNLAILGTARSFRFTAFRRIYCCVMTSSVCSHCLRFQSKGSVSFRDAMIWGGNFCCVFKVRWCRKSTKFWKWHCLTKIALGSRYLTQNWWSWGHFGGKLIFHIMKKKKMMFLKLTIKVVAFFLGHPVYCVPRTSKRDKNQNTRHNTPSV